MENKRCVVLGVTGGIAVYKALDVISALRKKDVDVRVIMPKAWEIQHISLAKRADVFLVAPATANIIGKVANGIADDMLSTTIMATRAKVVFAPAMNTNMYTNPIVQENIAKLKKLGYEFIEPASGRLAANIDPVRFISNRSTGKMGYAIAEEARDRGAEVVLVSGPTNEAAPYGINVIKINTNEEMRSEVLKHFETSDIVIKSAAVADYKAKEYSENKIKKGNGDLEIILTRDNDILKELGEKKSGQILVGFAAESQNVIENAKGKLIKKNLDYIVANDITSKDSGFASNDNRVTIVTREGQELSLEKMSKREVARNLFDII